MQIEGRGLDRAEIKELPKNVAEVKRPWADFRIAYAQWDPKHPLRNAHENTQNSDDVRGSEFIFLEDNGQKSTSNDAHDLIKSLEKGQYKEILKYAKVNSIPVFFAELEAGLNTLEIQLILSYIELGAGLTLTSDLIGHVTKERKMSRRSLLKATGAAWLGTQWGGTLPYGRNTLIGDLKKLLGNINEKVHPETTLFLTTLRNYVLAHKMENEAYKVYSQTKRRPIMTCVIGGAHVGLEKALQTDPQERIQIIQSILNLPGGGNFKKNISVVAKMTPNEKSDDGWNEEISANPKLFDPETWKEKQNI